MLKNSLLLVAASIVAVGLAELLARAVYDPPPASMSFFRLASSSFYQRDAELGWLPKPRVSGAQPGWHRRPASSFSTNSLGLRDREHALQRPPGLRRIVLLGDSFAWGWGIDDGALFADHLERLLPATEVVNLGVTGFGLEQQRKYLERLGLAFEPDLVLVALCQNDVRESTRAYLQPPASRPASEDPPRAGALSLLKQTLASHSAAYRVSSDAFNSNRVLVDLALRLGIKEELGGYAELDPNIAPSLKHYPAPLEEQWRTTLEQLRAMKRVADGRGVRFVVALIPALQSVSPAALSNTLTHSAYVADDFDLDKPYAALMQFATAEGFQMIDVLGAFRQAMAAGHALYLSGDMHFSPDGHELFAREIARRLEPM